jgi:hypothetical protein
MKPLRPEPYRSIAQLREAPLWKRVHAQHQQRWSLDKTRRHRRQTSKPGRQRMRIHFLTPDATLPLPLPLP